MVRTLERSENPKPKKNIKVNMKPTKKISSDDGGLKRVRIPADKSKSEIPRNAKATGLDTFYYLSAVFLNFIVVNFKACVESGCSLLSCF